MKLDTSPQDQLDYVRGRLLHWNLGEFTETFIQNGYDDIEVIRQINEEDLDEMGIVCLKQRENILTTIDQIFGR